MIEYLINWRIHEDTVHNTNGQYVSPPPQHEGVLIPENEKQTMFINSSTSMSDSASANHYQMRHQSQIAASQNPHLFFPTEPRSRSSSSRPTRPINGFLRNGNNTSHQNYEKMSSTMSRPVWNIVFSNENISNLNNAGYFWWWKINQIIIITLQLLNENGTAHDKRNSADAYCNGNGRTSILSENSGISLLHHPRSLSPLPHQRSKVCIAGFESL